METKLNADGLVAPSVSTREIDFGEVVLSVSNGNLFLNGEEIKSGGGHAVGEQWISMDGTIPDGGLAFLGQTVSKTTYYELYNWVETHNRFKTEAEWQSLYTANNGNVSYYAKVDDNTFRLPSFKGYLKANTTAGGYTKEGLPNITGSVKTGSGSGSTMNGAIRSGTEAFYPNSSTSCTHLMGGGVSSTVSGIYTDFKFDASRSSSIYGNSTHVTPETNTILVGVYAITSVNNTSGYDLQEIINIAESTREGAEELISIAEQSFNESLESIDNQINNISNNFGFIGEIKFSSYDNVPYGYLICDGSKISRTTYSALFNVIGTKWGTGDGSTTFTLPNLIGKVAWGATSAGTYKSAGLPSLPSHTHTFNRPQGDVMYGNGSGNAWCGSTRGYTETTTDASWGTSSFYGKSTTVQPPAATVVPVIKYI